MGILDTKIGNKKLKSLEEIDEQFTKKIIKRKKKRLKKTIKRIRKRSSKLGKNILLAKIKIR